MIVNQVHFGCGTKMAEKVVQKLEDQLNCSICLDTYTNPKLLQCFHVYCKECLVRLVDRDQRGQLSIACPNCQQATPIPDTGVSGLQSAFHINHLLEIVEEHKKEKDTAIAETTDVATGVALHQQKFSHCTEHVDEEVKLYCETCSEVICYKCISKWGKHHSGHDYESIGEAFQNYKQEISTFLEPIGNHLTRIDQALTDLETCSAEVDIQQDHVKANIEGTVRKLHMVLEARKTDLLNWLQDISQSKHKSLAAQKDLLETTQAQLHSCEGFVRQSIKTGCLSDVLKMKKTIIHQAKELTATEIPPSFLKPCTEPDMMFSAPGDTTAVLQQYGDISSMSMVDPAKWHAMGRGLETATVGEKSTATVQAVCGPIESLECELESMLTGARVRGEVKERGKGQYEISYEPVTKGRNLLHVRVCGLNIRGSPFDVRVVSPVEGLGVPIHTFGGLEKPRGVAFNCVGEIVISAGDSVSIFSQNGTKIRSFGDPGQFQYPSGVTVDDEGNILVADRGNDRFQKFTNDGQFLVSVGTTGTGPLQFNKPMDVAFNFHNKKVYVVDNENHRIQVLNSDLTFSNIIGGKRSSKDGDFAYPWSATFDSTGNVYIADSGNNRIQVYTASGKFLRKLGRCGKGKGELHWPVSVALDSRGMVLVSESGNHRISIFTTEGRFVKSFGWRGTKVGEFNYPRWLAVDDYDVLCVCDRDNDRVQIF